MAEKKPRKKKLKKDSQLIVRINGDERARFIAACEDDDSTAAREIRRFIRDYLGERE
ncbi:MAG: hypothetical protein AAGJ70_02075 [Pseudomonadota bacterium]